MNQIAQARKNAGFSLEEAASRVRITSRYLRQVERRGAPFALAQRLARLYGCPIDVFLFPRGSGTPGKPLEGGGTLQGLH